MDISTQNEIKRLEENCRKFDDLIGIHNGILKKTFLNFLQKGYSHESIGTFFENSLEKLERKNKGQFYTPKTIVEYIISQIDITKASKILDPACGCGSFLLTIFDDFKKQFGIKFLKNIFGVDINNNATNMTRFCLYMQTGFKGEFIPSIKQNIKTGNSIVSSKNLDKNAFNWNVEFNEVIKNGGFDFIIGNPPYVTLNSSNDFDVSESIYPQILEGPVNAATLMIGRSIELLKENGILAFLLPKSILYVDSYKKLRNYIDHKTEILQIYDLGAKFKEVRGEQFILFIRKNTPTLKNKVKICVFKDKDKNLAKQPFITIQQGQLARMDKFLVFDNLKYYELLNKISKRGIKLNEFVNGEIFRGLAIGGNRVNKENNYAQHIKIIRGKDISKFKLKALPDIDNTFLEQQNKNKISYLKEKKVVLQNIFSSEAGVIAAYDSKGFLTLDTVTNIIVENDEKGKYLLGLLSSKLINFYIMYFLFNRSRFTMHLDKSYIGLIPIIDKPAGKQLKHIIAIVNSLIEETNPELRKLKNKEIDKIIYKLYSLNKTEIKLIEEATAKMLSKKSLW